MVAPGPLAVTEPREPAAALRRSTASRPGNLTYYSYLMIFFGHSGSSALVEQFTNHPHVRASGYEPIDHGMGDDEAFNYTADLFKQAQADRNVVVGFKMRPRHILSQPDRWRALVREHRTRVIWQEDMKCVRGELNGLVNAAVECKLCQTGIIEAVMGKGNSRKCCDGTASTSILQFYARGAARPLTGSRAATVGDRLTGM